jgi:hypothetical protein
MNDQLLTVKATCRGASDPCLFEGQDLVIDIGIANNQDVEIGFPLAFRQKTGPVVRLIDRRTQADTYLKTNLADLDLRKELTPIQPGGSVTMEWVITGGEIQEFGGPSVDLLAEVIVQAGVRVRGKQVEFRGSDTLRIVSKDRR